VLTSSSSGAINRVFKYRSSGRRQYRINKRFQKNVALSSGHTLVYKKFLNDHQDQVNGRCKWIQLILGSTASVEIYRDFALAHWNGYKELDPNTGYMSGQQFPLKFKVMDDSIVYTGINTGSNKIIISAWTLTLKHDLHSDSMYPATAILGYSDSARLKDASCDAQNPEDTYLTPYMVPAVTTNYKISKARTFTVHAGGKFVLRARHSYDVTIGTASTAGWAGNTGLVARKPHFRCLLIKVIGELGVVTEGGFHYLRNTDCAFAGQFNIKAKLHVSEENRPIFLQQDTSTRREVIGGIASVLGEEILAAEITTNLGIDQTT